MTEWPALPDWFWYPVVFVYGAIVGSFLNVVIYRLPLGKHLSNPPSHCPNCRHKITFFENIPLLSFLGLRARCSDCKTPISWRYFCVELVTACIWTLIYHRTVLPNAPLTQWDFVMQALFAAVLIALVFIDLDHFIAPDELTILALVLGLGRYLVLFLIAWGMGNVGMLNEPYLYFKWLPIGVPGALLYGGTLFLVSLIGFVLYARNEGESLAAVTRRFFTFEDEDEETTAMAQSGMALVGPGEEPTETNEDDEEEDAPAPRLRFSPAFLTILSALCMAPVVQYYALFVLLLPPFFFVLLSRRGGEPLSATLRRFFHADDLGLPAQSSEEVAAAEAEAQQFAKEAETGKHGAMGLGDAKLALGIGALLGPWMALLSLFFATFTGAVTGMILARLHGKGTRLGIPFVPFMAAGCLIVQCYGPFLIDAYQGRFLPQYQPDPLRSDIVNPRTRERLKLPPLPR